MYDTSEQKSNNSGGLPLWKEVLEAEKQAKWRHYKVRQQWQRLENRMALTELRLERAKETRDDYLGYLQQKYPNWRPNFTSYLPREEPSSIFNKPQERDSILEQLSTAKYWPNLGQSETLMGRIHGQSYPPKPPGDGSGASQRIQTDVDIIKSRLDDVMKELQFPRYPRDNGPQEDILLPSAHRTVYGGGSFTSNSQEVYATDVHAVDISRNPPQHKQVVPPDQAPLVVHAPSRDYHQTTDQPTPTHPSSRHQTESIQVSHPQPAPHPTAKQQSFQVTEHSLPTEASEANRGRSTVDPVTAPAMMQPSAEHPAVSPLLPSVEPVLSAQSPPIQTVTAPVAKPRFNFGGSEAEFEKTDPPRAEPPMVATRQTDENGATALLEKDVPPLEPVQHPKLPTKHEDTLAYDREQRRKQPPVLSPFDSSNYTKSQTGDDAYKELLGIASTNDKSQRTSNSDSSESDSIEGKIFTAAKSKKPSTLSSAVTQDVTRGKSATSTPSVPPATAAVAAPAGGDFLSKLGLGLPHNKTKKKPPAYLRPTVGQDDESDDEAESRLRKQTKKAGRQEDVESDSDFFG